MDQIELVGESPDPPEGQLQPPSGAPTTSYSRQRAGSLRSRPSIRIQRPPSVERANWQAQQDIDTNSQRNPPDIRIDAVQNNEDDDDDSRQGRRRSNSEPRPGRWSSTSPVVPWRLKTDDNTNHRMSMYPLKEEPTSPSPSPSFQNFSTQLLPEDITAPPPVIPRRGSRLRRASDAALHRFSRNRASTLSGSPSASARAVVSATYDDAGEYHPQIVDVLDVIDPEVSALSTLTNVQNSLFVPNLGTWLNRQPTYTLSPPQEEESTSTDEGEELASDTELKETQPQPTVERLTSLSAVLEEGPDRRFAVLPEESNLEGWTKRDIEELNDRVRHMLHSRRSKFKRAMVGFGKYLSKPLGFLVTLYATLITLFGLAWVLFLIGWINVGGRQLYIINVIDNVLVALFAVMGDGLAPFRAIDTYHMIFIAHYTFLTWKIRRKRALPDLKDKNDLPARQETDIEMETDIEIETGDPSKGEEYGENEEHEFSVLSPAQQLKLSHHQEKLSKSHTFYKPHETLTHNAFPLRMLIAIIVLLDCHSLFQIALGACTWGISYHVRPFALTTVILCCSITCNITGGVLIMIGDRRTRKTDVVELLFRQQLTGEAMKKMRKKKRKEEIRKSMEQQKALEESPATPTSSQNPKPYEGT